MEIILSAFSLTFPQIDPYIDLGFFQLRYYSLAYIFGLLFAWWSIRRISSKPGAPMATHHIDDFFFNAAMGVIIGGRIGYVLFYNFPYYMENPLAILKLWDGGMSFHGGLIGVVLAVILFCRQQKLDLMRVADVVAIVSPIGLLLGRLANFINGELYGRPTDSWVGMVFPSDPEQLPRHPSQLYEALLEGLILFLILQYLYHFTQLKKKAGIIAGLFFAGYALSRFTVEYFREPDAHLGLSSMLGIEISRGQLLTIPMFIFAGWLMSQGFKRKK
ncbi:prolipoprotein diacylglyceryl transferase [Temperatibacter marinus]|uniref:Phosphatidylglycerol--prolipoprotein diacylglyceryl transferase n=1 Tax=Temperatibacter marinus TaxID=1456591 RepID=A0AA52EEL8_9PROT|nr:prolipoprotein diacylglyceryl transferase [Temperatibacter marinus]WND01668.1 prolipoprotein diacylglyceryl transferase [Temperatibacter marinus]